MITVDDRTAEQVKTHTHIVIGLDKFMSGWGKAKNGNSYAGWACKPKDCDKVWNWVENRKDISRIRLGCSKYRPRGNGHYHIYVVGENHPALQ